MTTESKAYRPGLSLDRLGIFASSACAVHCAITIFLPTLPALLGFGGMMGPETEWAFTIVAIVFAAAALGVGYFRHHRSMLVLVSLVVGVSGLLVARTLEGTGGCCAAHGSNYTATAIGIGAGLTLMVGHFFNLRECKSCGCSNASAEDHHR